MKLAGKRFVVTGAATGMGAATTAAFAREGAAVVGFYRNRSVEVLAERLRGEPGNARFVRVDVAERDEVFAAMADAVEQLGGIDGLVHAAAVAPTTAAEDIPFEQLMDVLRINVGGTMLTNQAAFPYLKANGGGCILNFASSVGAIGSAIKADYAASKGAVLAWSRSIAAAWGSHAITVNTICPVISTDMYQATRDAMGGEQLAAFDASLAMTIPLGGCFGDAERDFAPVVVFLASERARFITGQMISVDGGTVMVR